MHANPYKYKGPLDLKEDSLVCAPRSETVNRLIGAIMRGDYCAVQGPRQIGKTTFVKILKNTFKNAYYTYFDCQASPSSEEKLYRWMIDRFLEEVPSAIEISKKVEGDYNPQRFIKLLENFNPIENKRIILVFDEIGKIPSPLLETLLGTWRAIYNARHDRINLKKYNLIITGSEELIALPIGPNSPFNITEVIDIKDFSEEESKTLIEQPFKQLNIGIENQAKEKLWSEISGHPQLLQHACYLLVEKARTSNKPVNVEDVDKGINILFEKNSAIGTLKKNMEDNGTLRDLLHNILKGEKIKFHPFSKFSVVGAGAIKEKDSFCEIRNEVYKKFIMDILNEINKKKIKQRIGFRIFALLSIASTIISFAAASLPAIIITVIVLITIFIFPSSRKAIIEKIEKDEPTT